jgi:hypothetical protein
MTSSLERINSSMFRPLDLEESARTIGGAGTVIITQILTHVANRADILEDVKVDP